MQKLWLLLFLFSCSFIFGQELLVQKIQEAKNQHDKETVFIDWVSSLSQVNSSQFDSLIYQRNQFISSFSDDAEFNLLIIYLANRLLEGSLEKPKTNLFKLNASDQKLMMGLLKCYYRTEKVSISEYNNILKDSLKYTTNTKKSILWAVSTCVEGKSESAVKEYFAKALSFAKLSRVKTLTSSLLDVSTRFHLSLEYYDKALELQQLAIKYSEQNNLTGNLINHWITVGNIHFAMGNYKRAEESFFKAEVLSTKTKQNYLMGELYNCIGKLYSQQKKYTQAIDYYQKSLLKFYTINDFSGLAIVYRNMGKTYYIDKDYTLAQHNYILSEQFFNKTDLSTEKAELYYEMAKLNHVRREFNEAEKNVGKAIEMWKELSLFISLKKALLLAAQINYSRGNYKMASQYYEQYIHYNDSIGEVEINKKITELSELFQSEQKEHKIAEQERVIKEEANQKIFIKNQLESEQLRNRFIVTLLISIVLFSIGIILVIRFKNNKQKLILRHKELELQQALLRTQMNPHFIFNTISVIQSHIYNQDNSTALRFLMEFSKLMRLVLENSAKEFIPLDKELEINQHYLELQKLRFGDRFEFIIENKIEDFGIMVPPMIVQPFIENAIEHAELGKVEHGKIYLQYAIIDHYLTIIISDNGIGRKNAAKTLKKQDHTSMAIDLTNNRISLLNKKYKRNGYLTFDDLNKEKETGTVVTITTHYITNI